ncbi:hypothetical protein [Xylanibacter muris]|uniref:LPP20 lipoprotein n=1 Tax=Xylanibacter muris TaxID=2736290 RepID=A0ABX2ALL1_9BACT|nr:hypothetical protein [Xylanibacter muris]NPD91137.1 hypothetical protein [Xylanibacter muris]
MKKTLFISFVMATAVAMVSSCGGAGKTQSTPDSQHSNIYGAEITLTDCEQYALADPGRRAAGKGTSYNESTARNLAELDARATMSKAIDAAVEAAAKSGSLGYHKYSGNDNSGQTVGDEGTKTNDVTSVYSANIIKNANIVKVNKFFGKNRQYTVFVCLEYNGTVADIAKKVVENVRQNVSDADRKKIDSNLKEFEDNVLNNMRKSQMIP